MFRLLAEIDHHIDSTGLTREVLLAERPPRLNSVAALDRLDLRAAGIRTVIWATGHRRVYPWLKLPVLDDAGEIRHRHGVTELPGLYVIGQRFQHFRNSNFIDGVGRDACFLANHITTTVAPAPHH